MLDHSILLWFPSLSTLYIVYQQRMSLCPIPGASPIPIIDHVEIVTSHLHICNAPPRIWILREKTIFMTLSAHILMFGAIGGSSAIGVLITPSWPLLWPKKTKCIFYCASFVVSMEFNFHNRVSLGFLQFAWMWTWNAKREHFERVLVAAAPCRVYKWYVHPQPCQFMSNYRVFPLTWWSLERVAVGKKREYAAHSDSFGSIEFDIWTYIARG